MAISRYTLEISPLISFHKILGGISKSAKTAPNVTKSLKYPLANPLK